MNLSGLVVIRNGRILDYCFVECIKSLLPVCDTVCVSVAEGDDETEEEIREWASREPKLIVNIYPWKNPKGDPNFFVDWLQYGRQHCPAGRILQLDADEVLHESAYEMIERRKNDEGRFTVQMIRHNFWRDTKHLIPEGVCCAKWVIRMGPQEVFLPSDGSHPDGAEWVNMQQPSMIEIFHYGFLRKREAWFKKARALQGFFFNDYDKRLEKAETYEGNWSEMPEITGWENQLVPFTGTHPEIAKGWLRERGYAT